MVWCGKIVLPTRQSIWLAIMKFLSNFTIPGNFGKLGGLARGGGVGVRKGKARNPKMGEEEKERWNGGRREEVKIGAWLGSEMLGKAMKVEMARKEELDMEEQ